MNAKVKDIFTPGIEETRMAIECPICKLVVGNARVVRHMLAREAPFVLLTPDRFASVMGDYSEHLISNHTLGMDAVTRAMYGEIQDSE